MATGATWSEGPCWIPDAGVLRWSDIHGDRILQYAPSAEDPARGETSEHRRGVEFTNGRTWHPEGYVVQCSHGCAAWRLSVTAPWNRWSTPGRGCG